MLERERRWLRGQGVSTVSKSGVGRIRHPTPDMKASRNSPFGTSQPLPRVKIFLCIAWQAGEDTATTRLELRIHTFESFVGCGLYASIRLRLQIQTQVRGQCVMYDSNIFRFYHTSSITITKNATRPFMPQEIKPRLVRFPLSHLDEGKVCLSA